MKINAVLLYLLFWQPALQAQEPDTVKAKQLMDSVHSFLDSGHFGKALVCIDSASKIYEVHGIWEKQIRALNQKPIPYARLGKVDSVTQVIKSNLKSWKKQLGFTTDRSFSIKMHKDFMYPFLHDKNQMEFAL